MSNTFSGAIHRTGESDHGQSGESDRANGPMGSVVMWRILAYGFCAVFWSTVFKELL